MRVMLPEERRDGRQARHNQTAKAAFAGEKWFHLLWYELRYGASDVSMWKPYVSLSKLMATGVNEGKLS